MTPNQNYGSPMPASTVNVAYTGTAGTTTAMPDAATCVRLRATTDCFVEISVAGTAAVASTGFPLGAFESEYFDIPARAKISAIQSTAGGTIYVTPF